MAKQFFPSFFVFTQKQMILTNERCAEHPVAGQNTQQISNRENKSGFMDCYCCIFLNLLFVHGANLDINTFKVTSKATLFELVCTNERIASIKCS